MKDKVIENIIKKEKQRQEEHVELIASENFVSNDILETVGSVLTNKYAEGYPSARYYGGCENVDEAESLAIKRLNKIFNSKYSNVQPHSGSQANSAVYLALLNPGDKILGMSLNAGGHLTHGHSVSSSGKIYESYFYGVDKDTYEIDYDEVLRIAKEVKPKMIICGASAYPRKIDFKKFKEIANEVGAYVLADVAHIAGLIVAGLHQNPLDVGIDVVTSTTHKTLRGPRGGIILTNNEEIAQKINKAVFPGIQGGPLMHVIAGKAVSFWEADKEEFKEYQKQVIINANTLSNELIKKEVKVLTNGTDNHLLLIDVKKSFNISGARAEELLYEANIIVNKNSIPFDEERPTVTSGIRMGTPAMTTKGWKEKEFKEISNIIYEILNSDDLEFAKSKKKDILKML